MVKNEQNENLWITKSLRYVLLHSGAHRAHFECQIAYNEI